MINKVTQLTEKQLYGIIIESVSQILLTEASELSLHQKYDKIYGTELIDELLSIDQSNKKKFAEWVLKTIFENHADKAKDYLNRDLNHFDVIKPMAESYFHQEFQPLSFDDIESAYREYIRIQKAKTFNSVKPVYNDGTIIIYNPKTTTELKDLLEIKFKKDPSTFHWCVADPHEKEANSFWNVYTKNNKYKLFVVYNASLKKLFLWNNNPCKSPYNGTLICHEFNNYGNKPCSPITDANLTEEAIGFLNQNSSRICSFDDVISYIDDGEPSELAMFADGILGGRYDLIDYHANDEYEHSIDLIDSRTGSLVYEEFCPSNCDAKFDDATLFVATQQEDFINYIAYLTPNGDFKTAVCEEETNCGNKYILNLDSCLLIHDRIKETNAIVNVDSIELGSIRPTDSSATYLIMSDIDYITRYVVNTVNGQVLYSIQEPKEVGMLDDNSIVAFEMYKGYTYNASQPINKTIWNSELDSDYILFNLKTNEVSRYTPNKSN